MKRAILLGLLCAACGVDAGAPSLPLSVTLSRASGTPIAKLQVILAAPSSRFDPLAHPKQCTRSWIPADETLQLTGSDGKTHPSQVIDLTSDASQTAQVTGIPPAKSVLLVVEGISADGQLVALGFKSPIDEITAGDNAAVSVTVTSFDPVDCSPLY